MARIPGCWYPSRINALKFFLPTKVPRDLTVTYDKELFFLIGRLFYLGVPHIPLFAAIPKSRLKGQKVNGAS